MAANEEKSMFRARTVARICVASSVGTLLALNSAHAASCDHWLRLDADEKASTVVRMIDDALAGNRGRKYDVNREAIARCLHSRAAEMTIAFDDVCASSRSAGMQAIREVFDTYVWSCVG
jgi:hypothetical protein